MHKNQDKHFTRCILQTTQNLKKKHNYNNQNITEIYRIYCHNIFEFQNVLNLE